MSSKIGHQIVHLDTVKSTNSYLLALLEKENVDEGTVISAVEQSGGRGQRLNSWESERGKNMTLSLFLKPAIKVQEHFVLNKMISIGIVDFLREFVFDELSIKWPNDIYVDDYKIGGILIESKIVGSKVASAVIGIGININQTKFDTSIPNPISIKGNTGKLMDLNECLTKLCLHIEDQYARMKSGKTAEIDKAYELLLYRLNQFHEFIIKGNVAIAKIIGVDDIGKLILRSKTDQLFYCDMKEVEYRIKT
ncbi:MAG: biotin--[acetyl-CoA-carboxylase] ligase [Bacteroidetes bacterium]|nr:biotin--[acetyl-CoA-carboxylase] ligase [Bacteroidota bacterium]